MKVTGPILLQRGGSTPRGSIPEKFRDALDSANESVELDYPNVVEARIQKITPQAASDDGTDDKDFITVCYTTEDGTLVTTVHIHDDNTFNEFPSKEAWKGKE